MALPCKQGLLNVEQTASIDAVVDLPQLTNKGMQSTNTQIAERRNERTRVATITV